MMAGSPPNSLRVGGQVSPAEACQEEDDVAVAVDDELGMHNEGNGHNDAAVVLVLFSAGER